MKKNTLLQLIVIYVGFSSVYAAVNIIVQQLYLVFSDSNSGFGSYNMHAFISYMLLGFVGAVVIFASARISNYIAQRTGLSNGLTVFSTPQQLLSILIVVTALAHLLNYLPGLIIKLIDAFIAKGSMGDDMSTGYGGSAGGWAVTIMHIIFPCLLIVFARNLTTYFAKNIIRDDESMVLQQDDGLEGNEGNLDDGENV